MVKLGLTRAYGSSLQRVIAANTKNRFRAFLSGMAVTAVLQSSTATALMVASFAANRLMDTAAGLAVMIGADVSITLVAQLLVFDLSWLMPVLLVLGVILNHFYEEGGRMRHVSRTLIGLGLILLSLSLIREVAVPLGSSEILPLILAPLESEPVLAMLAAAMFTWMLHSSLAAILIFASFASAGVVDFHLGLLLVLGANFGSALIPLVMTSKMKPAARRITVGNLLMRSLSILLLLPFLDDFHQYFIQMQFPAEREIVNAHTLFNICLAVMFLPLIRVMALLCNRVIPDERQQESLDAPRYLDDSSLHSPTIALAGAARETMRIAEIVQDMFVNSMFALKRENMKIIEEIKQMDLRVDALHMAIKLYLTKLNHEDLDPAEADRMIQILTFSTNLEYIGDIIENSIMDITMTKIKTQQRFSDQGFQEIKDFHQAILNNMKLAQVVFMSGDVKLANQLVEDKKSVREAEQKSSVQHFQRLREGLPETISTSGLHMDIIRDYRRINSYVTNVAYPVLNNAKKKKPKVSRESPVNKLP